MGFLDRVKTGLKTSNSLRDWGVLAMALVAIVVIICVPLLTIFLGIALIVTRYYDYKESIYELKTKRMFLMKSMDIKDTETQNKKDGKVI